MVPQLFHRTNEEGIDRFIKEWRANCTTDEEMSLDLLVIDTFATATVGADENSAMDVGKIISACRCAAEELGCAILLVHHCNKGGSAERGSSALRGAMDFMIEIRTLTDGNNKKQMVCSKLKDGAIWRSQEFTLSSVEDCESVCVEWLEPGKLNPSTDTKAGAKAAMLAIMKSSPGQKLTAKEYADLLDKKPPYVGKLLGEMIAESICEKECVNVAKSLSSLNPYVYFLKASREEGKLFSDR